MALHSSAGKDLYVSFDINQQRHTGTWQNALSADVRKDKRGKLTANRASQLNKI